MPLNWNQNYWEKSGFTVGETVEILPYDKRTDDSSLWGHLIWVVPMSKNIGKIGIIRKIRIKGRQEITRDGEFVKMEDIKNVQVKVEDTYFYYPPWQIKKSY